MKILVVIPTHNRVEFFNQALASVKAQTRQPDQIVVIGNTGPIGPYFQSSDEPLHVRINQAIRDSNCEAFIVLCDDDLLDPQFIEKTDLVMRATGTDIVFTYFTKFGEIEGLDTAWHFIPITALFSRRVWDMAGGYTAAPFLDWDFWWQCLETGAAAVQIPESLWKYRIHPGQEGLLHTEAERAELAKIVVARHKRSPGELYRERVRKIPS